MRVKKVLCGLLAATLVAASFAGCQSGTSNTSSTGGGSTTTDNDKPYEGVTLNMVCPTSIFFQTIIDAQDEFKEQTGISFNAEQLTNDQLAQKISVTMAAGGKDIDIITFAPIQSALLYNQNGWLTPLNDYIDQDTEFDFDDFSDSSVELAILDDQIMGVPIMTEREVVTYNTAYFEEAGVKEIPTTFEELEAAAAACNGLTNESGNTVNGIALRGKGQAAVTQFSGFLYGYGGDFIEDGKAVFNSDAGIEAFEFYGKLAREYGPTGAVNMDWQETQNLYAQGMVAMRVDCDSQYGFSVDPESSIVAEDTSMFALPAGPEGAHAFNITAWALGISSGSQNKEAAWEFISWAVGKEMDVRAMAAGNPSARDSSWQNDEATSAFPEEMVEVINETLPTAVGYDRPVMINVGEARTEIGNVIITAIEGGDVKAAADKAAENVQKLLDEEAEG